MRIGNRNAWALRIVATCMVVALGGGVLYINNAMSPAKAAGGTVVFGVGGDFSGESGDAATTMQVAGQSGLDFLYLTGDYDQGYEGGAAGFCSVMKANVNTTTTPVLMVSGNHEAEDAPSGSYIENYTNAGCLPNTLGSRVVESPYIDSQSAGTTNYGKEYYVDYPAVNPVMRLVSASPRLSFMGGDGPTYDYSAGSDHYNWVQQAITSAKSDGLWVVLAFHKPYLNVGNVHGSDSESETKALYNLALNQKVDVILNGHEHMYQRSKQLATGTGCAQITQNSSYNSACVVHAGTVGDPYVKGGGTVQLINAASGSETRQVDTGDGDYQYFAKLDSSGSSRGITKFTVTNTQLTANFIDTDGGGFTDSFTIASAPSGDTTAPTGVALTAPANGATLSGTVSLTATATDETGVARVEFYDGVTLLSTDTTSPYGYSWNTGSVTTGSHTLKVIAYDAAGNSTASADVPVTIASAPSGDTTAPTGVALTAPANGATLSGTVSLTATATDETGVARVEFYRGTTLLNIDTTSPYSFAWDTATVANGAQTLKAIAYDAAGNSTTSSNVSVTVTNTSGTVTPTTDFSLLNQDSTSTTAVSLSGTCSSVQTSGKATSTPSVVTGGELVSAFGFTASCGSSGGIAQVAADLGKQYTTSKLKVYKDQSDGSVKDITSSVVFSERNVGGVISTVFTYTVVDGTAGDTDGTANGTVVDPVYVVFDSSAASTGSTSTGGSVLASTGSSAFVLLSATAALLVAGLGIVVAARQTSAKR